MNERIRLENDWGLLREAASIRLSNGETNVALRPFPTVPTISPQEIIDLAETLNKFVSKND